MNNYEIVRAITGRGHCADCNRTIPAHECKLQINYGYKYYSKVHYVRHVCRECGELRINDEIKSLQRTVAELHANIPGPREL
jgi:RNase P subunit RPR2